MSQLILEAVLGTLGIRRTEAFFSDVQETREALQRISQNELHPFDGTSKDRAGFQYMKLMALGYREIPRLKKQATLLSPDGRWCYVPKGLQKTMDTIKDKEKLYSQFYWNSQTDRRVYA